MTHQVSKCYTNDSFGGNPNLDQKILIFENRVLYWHLEIAELINNHMLDEDQEGTLWNHAGFALLSLVFTYFEMIGQYRSGKPGSHPTKMFRKGITYVYPEKNFSKDQCGKIYNRVRCGMYHNAFIKKGTLIGRYDQSIEVENGGNVKINPHSLSVDVNSNFKEYIKLLKDEDETELRANFEKMYDF
ncbi:MAG: hypothetical protein CME33_19680 [Gimesia sp.]|uniref:hypothetical protein n=1 Tax=Gimesia sp. TaxID=2024833 RepID=UPI000C35F15E|nr:hypothetical protein [Gimesia sp.]MAX38784.1 hypothetical protein [Gimesia sp.]|tara:strand:- start:1278 stop:1838 length:561 start_codon:yes stop_codon:yes gene_type:complete